jgi:hypothetical protein
MQLVYREGVPLQKLRERYKDLRLKYRVRMSVIDSLPYTDMVLALQAIDQNLYASVYSQTKGTDLFSVKKREEDEVKGLQQQRSILVNRDKTFDALMSFVRSGQFSVLKSDRPEDDDELVAHFTDMRRIKDWDSKEQEIKFKWVKSEMGMDHLWFATSYAFLAKFILGAAEGGGGGRLPLLSSIRLADKTRRSK